MSYFLSSLPAKVKTLAKPIRQHWSIESQLHWVLDVTFTEDASRIRKQHAPQISAMLRRLAVSILSPDTSLKDSLRGKRYRAASPPTSWNAFCSVSSRNKMRLPCRLSSCKCDFCLGTPKDASKTYVVLKSALSTRGLKGSVAIPGHDKYRSVPTRRRCEELPPILSVWLMAGANLLPSSGIGAGGAI